MKKIEAILGAVGVVAIALAIDWVVAYFIVKWIFGAFGVTAISPAVVATLIVVFGPRPNNGRR